MQEIPYVKRSHADVARKLEDKIIANGCASLAVAGVDKYFVGVSATPTKNGQEPTYEVFVGCPRGHNRDTICDLIKFILIDDATDGVKLEIIVKSGQVNT